MIAGGYPAKVPDHMCVLLLALLFLKRTMT